MKKILLTGCGGAPTLSFVRSLRDADPKGQKYYLVGTDSNKYSVHRSECDKNYLCPPAKDKKYISYLLEILKKEKIDFMHTQPEIEVYTVGKHRSKILDTGCKLFMPKQKTIAILRDKFKSYEVWSKKKITVPRNILIDDKKDLKNAFKELGNSIWIRETIGAAGKGSLSNPSYDLAKAWIDYRGGWGKTVAAQRLTDQTTTWQSIWQDGTLVAGQGRKRLYWEMSNRTQSGVTGITGTGTIVNNKDLAKLAIKCIKAVDNKPHGIFSVDFTYDKNGVPNPTEINIGKFFTTHHFITRAGCNMPEMMVLLAFNEYQGKYNQINPCQEGFHWIRGMDTQPTLVSEKEIANLEKKFQALFNRI